MVTQRGVDILMQLTESGPTRAALYAESDLAPLVIGGFVRVWYDDGHALVEATEAARLLKACMDYAGRPITGSPDGV